MTRLRVMGTSSAPTAISEAEARALKPWRSAPRCTRTLGRASRGLKEVKGYRPIAISEPKAQYRSRNNK